MLEQLLESLDEKVFTTELKESLSAQFNEAVEAKADEKVQSRIEQEIESLNEKAEEYTNLLNEQSEKHIDMIDEKAEEFIKLKEAEMLENVDKYLDRVVEEFVSEAQESLEESTKSEKADMLIEAFETMLIAGGVSVSQIVEAKDESAAETKLQETVSKHDALVEEVIALSEENDKLIAMGVIAEQTEGLSIVEAEKFKNLAELVEFSRDVSYNTKLETIKENIKGSKEEVVTEAEEVVTEAEVSTTIQESEMDLSRWKHLA